VFLTSFISAQKNFTLFGEWFPKNGLIASTSQNWKIKDAVFLYEIPPNRAPGDGIMPLYYSLSVIEKAWRLKPPCF
jgi:hypothetical protein